MAEQRIDLRLAIALGTLGLARPVLSIVGAFDDGSPIAKPLGPVLLTGTLAVVWVAAAVIRRVARPIETLAAAGLVYALLAIVLNLALQPLLDSAEPIPLPGYVAIPLFNVLWGAALGCLACLLRLRRPVKP